MGMIDRYKKSGGFLQLVQLLETMSAEKRENFLRQIAVENPVWDRALRQKMLSINRLAKWQPLFLMEFLPSIPSSLIGMALTALPEEDRVNFITSLGFAAKKALEDFFKEERPKASEIASAQVKLINEARAAIASRQLKLEKCDPDLVIPEDYEKELANSYTQPEKSENFVRRGEPTSTLLDEDVTALRRKLVALAQENNRLQKEASEYKNKVERVKAALSNVG